MRDLTSSKSLPALHLRYLTFLVAGVLFMEFLDGTVITTALPVMAATFQVSAIDLNVGVSAYLIALGVFIPISGWMAQRYGARRVFMAAIIIFTVASLLCGMANDLATFVVVRVLQGFGGAMMVPVGRLIVLRNTPKDKLISAIATLVWPALVAPVIGPALGGYLSTYFSWRLIFYLNIPLGMVALLAASRFVPDTEAESTRRFDWIGFILCATGISIFLYGAELLSGSAADFSHASIVLLSGSALLILAYVYLRRTANPVLDFSNFSVPTFAVALRGGSLTRVAVGSAPFLLPLMFQIGFGYDPFQAGLLVMAVFVGNLVMKAVTTPILKRFGFRSILVWNGLLASLSLLACALLTRDTPVTVIVLVLFVGGLSRSMQFTAINTVAFADIDEARMAPANALFSTLFQLSLGAGVAFGAIAIRTGEYLARVLGSGSPSASFSIAFILVSLLALLSLADAARLHRDSGNHLAGALTQDASKKHSVGLKS